MVGMLLRWKWKGEKKSNSKKERTKESNSQTDLILYHSKITERKKSTTSQVHIHIPTSYKYVQRYKYTRDIYLPTSYLLNIISR